MCGPILKSQIEGCSTVQAARAGQGKWVLQPTQRPFWGCAMLRPGRALLSKRAILVITDFQTKLGCAPRPRQSSRSLR